MRIVAGEARGRRIASVEGVDVRPTMDRVREAIFNSLTSHGLVEDRVLVDLFAGSGALGLEALSRGAERVVFADLDRRAVEVVERNLATFGFSDRAQVHRGDGVALARTLDAVDVALCDPPYSFDAWPALLDTLADRGVEAVVVESDRAIEPGSKWQVLKQQRYAGTVVTIARARRRCSTDVGRGSRRPGGQPDVTRALYPGSFDPVHIGHVAIVEVAARCFDEVVVVAMYNREKTDGYFTLAERESMLAETFAAMANVTTASAPGLVIQAAVALGADVIVKGVRSGTDLDSEMQMAQTNNHVSGFDTVLVPTRPEHAFVSSRYIREIHAQGEDVSSLVPAPVARGLAAKRENS